jgi:hypothetical protein
LIKLEQGMDVVSPHRQGLSMKVIARRPGIPRHAVRLALRREEATFFRRPAVSSKLDPDRDDLLARLAVLLEATTASQPGAAQEKVPGAGREGLMVA